MVDGPGSTLCQCGSENGPWSLLPAWQRSWPRSPSPHDLNSILHRISDVLECVYLPLLALNAVALVAVFALGYAGWQRSAKMILRGVLVPNTFAVLFLLGAIVREATAIRTSQGGESGMVVGMLAGYSAPLFLEFLLLLAA